MIKGIWIDESIVQIIQEAVSFKVEYPYNNPHVSFSLFKRTQVLYHLHLPTFLRKRKGQT